MSHAHFSSCIDACNACADACDHCSTACLAEDNPGMMARCILQDMDCAAICRQAAAFMSRGSEHSAAICALCAEICDSCAAECEKHAMDHCRECAKACRLCADECRRVATSPEVKRAKEQGLHAH